MKKTCLLAIPSLAGLLVATLLFSRGCHQVPPGATRMIDRDYGEWGYQITEGKQRFLVVKDARIPLEEGTAILFITEPTPRLPLELDASDFPVILKYRESEGGGGFQTVGVWRVADGRELWSAN